MEAFAAGIAKFSHIDETTELQWEIQVEGTEEALDQGELDERVYRFGEPGT